MAIDRSKLQRMHKLMAENGYTQDYNTFEKKFTGESNYANRKKVYDLFTQNGADLGGSYEEFMRKLQKPRATKPQQQPKTALGRAQQSVAKEKWGGYGGAVTPMQNDSELVRGLKNADAAQRLQAPVSYTKPGAVKQMVKQTRERQHVVGQNVEQAGRQFTNRERDRRNAPAFDLGNENVNNNLVKTRGQLEKDMEKSGTKLVDDEFSKYISDVFKKEDEAAFERGQNAALNVIASSPSNAVFNTTRARNEEMSPEKRLANITNEIESNIHNLFSSPKTAERINAEAARLGVSPDKYIEHTLVPSLMNKVSSDFDKTELKSLLPSGAIETILMHTQNSMTGALASMGLMTKSQRQYGQRALSETLEGNNPKYNPGLGTRVAGSTLSFMMDMTPIGMAEKPAAAVAGKVFGNGVAQTARIANTSLAGRIGRMAAAGAVSQGVTGVLYNSTNAAVQNYSTGDDTSIGNTVKVMVMGGLSEGASWATMGGIGGVVGAGIYNVSGVKRIPAKAFQLAMEGIGMHMGGNVAKTIEGHDTDWLSVEGNLEACANVVALKLTHARLPKRQSKDGIKESYLDVVARNIKSLMTSDGQRAAFGGYTFTNEEKEQLFGSASAPKRNESIYGYDAHNNPLTRKESLTSWAMRAKKTAAKGKGEESDKNTDAEFVKTAYDEIMADNTIPWDTKAKFSALVMGTVPSARPMMENCRIEGGSVNEYSKNGELLSKNSFKSIDERNSIIYSLNMKREDQRLSNAYGAAQIKDEKTAQATLEAVAEANGMTAEQLKAAMDKQPLRRSDEEQNACVALRKAYEDEQFVPGTLHAEQSNTEGKDVVEENGLGTETPNNEAVAEVLGDLTKAEDALQAAMDGNDVLKEEYERMQKAGMSNPQIYMELFNSGLTQEQLAPLADYINALSKAQGMFKGTQDKIVETTQKHVGQWSYKDELNGEKQNGEQMVFVKDNKGRVLIVGAGDVAFDGEGRVRDGDMLTVYDPATREMDFVHAKDVTLERTTSSEEYAKDYQRQLEELNSTVYAEMQSGGDKPSEASLSLPKPGEQPVGEEGNEALLGLSKPTKPLGEKETTPVGEKETIPVGEEPVATFADGTPVPMMKDSKGRETADYSQMTAEQGAEWIKTRFGENADGFVDGRIKRAEKAVKAAEKMKVDFSGEEEDVAEALASRKAAIESAEKKLNYFTAVKNVMKQTKAAESAAGGEGATGNRYEQWRKDGYHIGEGGVRYDRQKKEDMTGVYGKDVKVDFTPTVGVNGRAKVVEVDSVQASHVNGQVNPMHFGPDWQPKDRTDIASKTGQDKALANFDPEKITGDGNAFIGSSPSVNERHETIQGNNRVEILRRLYDEQPEKAAQYKQWLIDHAEEYGLDAAEIAKMKKPILVNELPVDDAKALELGQYRASDFESGGKELPRTSVVINRLGDKMQNVANIMLRQGTLPEDAKMSDLVSQNATKVFDYLVKEGVVSATEEQTLRKDSTAMRQWMGELLKTGLFEGDKETEAAFNQLSDNARRAVLATYLRDAKSGDAAKIKQNLQRSFEAYSRMMNNPAFVNAKNVEEARAAVSAEIEKGNNSLFGEEPVRELFSNFELELAVLYKGLKDQKTLTGLLNKYFDAVQGDKVSNRQLEIGEEPREAISKEEALKEVFGLHESKPAETQRQVDKAIKIVATEITKKTGIEVVTDEKEAEEVIRESEETDSNLKYHKETDEATLEELENGETVKVYRAMQVIDGKLYPPMAAAVNGKRVEANELGTWIRADENPDLAIPDIDPKTKEQKVDKKTGELKWKFKLDKGGKDATGKKATDIPAAYNPYWHTSRSPLNDQFKSAWIRPNIVVVECEVPVSELSSGYRAERAKDAVGEVDWKSGVVSGEVYKQTGRARKVILSRWCKPVRVLSDAEVAQRAKEFVGDAKVEIPENVLTPRQRIEFEKAGFKIGAPEKGVKKSDQILEALKRGLQIDNEIKEHRSRWAGGEVVGMKQLPDKLHTDPDMLWNEISQYHGDYITRKLEKVPEDGTVKFFSAHDGKWYFYSVDKNHTITLFDAVEASRENYELFKDKLKKYGFDGNTKTVRDGMQEVGYTGRTDSDKYESFLAAGVQRGDRIRAGASERNEYDNRRGMAGETDGTQLEGNSEKQGEVKYFRTANGEVYGFTDGEKIYLDTKKMKPETPLHEYAHLWCDMLRRVNPKEWENVKKLFDKVEGLKDEVQKLYPELEGDALYEEMITTYSGREGTKKLEDVVRKLAAEEGKSVTESAKAQGFLAKVKEALTKYWKGVADVLGIHFTTAEEVADKVLADWAKGVDPRESEKGRGKSEESDTKVEGNEPSEASLGIPKPLGEKGAAEQEGVEPSKTNPLAWLAHTAEMFKDEQVQKAKDGLVKAKESGDAEDIKRATADMKQAMETKLRGNGIGLVERRRIIGREIGKILGEEAGKAEAEKIDKPWEQMDLEEREAVSSKNPLTETEINELTSEENRELIPAALAYLRGDKGNIINAISYFKIWNDVRSRHENVPDNSGAKDGTQLDAPDTGGSQELELGRGRESGRPDGSVDRGAGNEAAPGERNGREGNQNDTTLSAGEQGNKQGEGNTSRMGTVPARGSDTRGGGRLGNEGNVPKRGGQGGGNRPLDPNAGRKPTAKQGTHFPDSTSERLKQERAEYEQKKKDFWERWKKAGQGYMKISLTPFKALNLSPEQIEMLPELFKMHLNGAVLKIKEGIYKFNEWKAAMRAEEGEELKMIGLSDDDIDRFIEDYWNTPYQMDGETHTIGEWAGIHGNEKLRNKLSEPLNDKYQRQVDAEPIKVKIGDKKNIEETLPYLLPQQQEDVLKAETQFFGKEHADREHAYGKGYMFTNGTGTGKTFTGLGVAKRLVKQGKGRILIVTPSQKKVSDWIKDGRNLNMEIRDLDSIAKERGTTATTESGEGVVITTFANFGVNKKLLETKWDAVIYDESHRIMENKNGTETARSMQHYMVTNRSENHCFLRLQETNKDYQKMKSLGERFDAERGKEVKRIQDEYKASHPSATPRDVAYATSRMLPKEINGFTPGDYASFPKLGKIHAEFVKALSHYTNEVEPKLKAQAKNEWKDTKTIFLSATPFNTRENLDYAEGYIFKYPEVEKGGRISGRTQFYLDHFGAAYKFRYNRLEQSTSNPEAVAKQEIEFSDYLQDTLGTMSGRIIDSPYDYSRDFPTVSPDHAEEFNQAVQDAVRGHGVLADAYRRTIGDYNYGSALFETMKVANIIERIKAHLDAGRKVVIFHRRVETKEPLKPPFASMLEQANRSIALMKPGEEQKKAIQAVKDFRKKYADLLEWEQTLDYSMPREQIAKVFGKDKVLFFSGKESTKAKDKAVDTFNSDDSGKNIIVIQEASGKEGISLHDTTGKHQRVCITLALPQSPITALQIEGRTYRIGNKSNAIFEYPILGLNSEMMLFGQKFNNQVSTTENLALGSQARNLRDSFANGILEHSGVVPIDQQGVGGKEFDAPKDQSTDGFDNAVLDYYSNQKLNSRNREGVDYFPTPEPLGYKMMEWANMGEGDTVLEPSAGHGAIARYAPKGNQMVAIEPSQSLFTKLQLKAGGLGRKFQNTIFENYDISNKHDVVVMNPPFGTAGATAIAHLGKAFKHLEEGGRVVALIPRGSTDKKFEKWIEGEKTAVMRAEVELPDIVFKQAGTNVVCRVVVVDKISNEAMRAKAGSVEKWNLGGHYDKIEDFFEDLRDVEMPDRIIDTKAIMMKKSKQTVKDLKELKDARVDFNEGGINVRVRGDWKDYSIPFDMDGYSAEQKKKFLASTYETFEQQERQTRNETSQAVLAELKKLTCKLADMTEEEMQRYLKKKYEGKGVMYRLEHAAEVYNKAKQHYRMELGNTFSDSKEHFDAVRDRAVEEKGIVMPNLNKEKVKVVEVEKSPFGNNIETSLKNAREWAKENLVTTGKAEMPTMRDGTPYTISKRAVEKYLSESAVRKSENLDIHLSVLPKLTDVIHESIEAEIHADYKKGEDGIRGVENGYGEGVLVHRLYGAVEIDGKIYRVKTTMQEFRGGEENKPHSYEVTKIELLDSPGKRENPDRPPSDASNNSKNITSEGSEKANESDSLPLNSATNGYISTAKLLQGVEKSYDSGKKLLGESKDLTDGETLFRKESDKPKSGNKLNEASLSLSKPLGIGGGSKPLEGRIAETVEKVSKKTGGKVKMVNAVEEIGNEQVRRDIENGKQVTGWYDENTGEVHLYMPNIHDAYTAEKTVWHETVGHKGMRGLLGDKFKDYMRGLWMDLDNPVNAELRAYVKERMGKDSMGFYDAIEEFIAESAEKGKGEPGFWNYIKNKVTDALHEIGYRISPNVKDVKYMLWLAKNVQKKGNDPWWKMRADAVKWKIEHENDFSITEENGMLYDNNGKKHGLLDLNKKDFDEATDGRVHYRTSPMAASKIEEYNRRLSTKWYAFRESTVDDMQSLQEAMQIISGVKDAYTDIPSAFNPLLCHNRMGSMVMQMCERYDRECTEPLGDAFKKVVSAMPGKDGAEQTRNANLYFIKKHGLERNRVLFVRDKIREKREVKSEESNSIDALEAAWNGEKSDLGQKLRSGQIDLREYYRQMDEWIVQNIDKDFKAEEHDYSGMHGIYDVKKGEEYDDVNVIDEVMSTESQLGADLVKSFWDAKKKATDFTIDQVYANGFKDKKERDHLKEMFDWYVPLRKFDDTVAEDVYGYISGGDTKNNIGSVIEKARGRESLSDVNVLAQISALAKSSIINGGKNVEKQHFMRFVEVYEKGDAKDRIFVEIQPWVEKHTVDGNEVWEEVMPNIPENSTQEQINEILNTFETTMKAKQAKGEAKIARRKSEIGYKFERSSDMNQHIVNVYVNGRVRRFVCQGNPRAAQAINGLLRDSGIRNWATEKSAKMNRICAQLNTSLNPDFISSNLMRDLTFASANLTKEGMGYTWDFCMEYAKNWGSMVRRKDGSFDGGYLGMFRRYKEGRLDTNNQKERWFKEFMDNGGETGFVSLKKYEDIIKEYENLVKTGNKDGDRWLMKKLKEGGALVELANEVVENVARYSTYCVSRKRGRSIGKSIYDAKEVSSNFNRHGSGDAVKSLKTEYDGKTNTAFRKSVGWFNSYMKNQTMFYNAGVQGANLFAKNIKHAPKTAAIAFGAMPFGLNIAVALLNQLLISQEDEKKRNGMKNPYAELPEWKRRNNLCIYWGGGKFKTIPMGIELRAFYGLGDIAAGYMVDESLKSDTPIGFDVIGQMAQLVPASDFLGHHSPSSGIKESLEDVALSLTPTVAKPELELAFNRNWTGRPIYRDKDYLDRAPRWKSAYDNTNDVYMTINKWANKTFNGIDDTNEDLKGSGMMADAADFFTAPYGLQHIVEGYTGGTGATIGRTYQTGKSLVNGVVSGIKDDKDFKEGFKKEWKNVAPNSIPFYRVFNYTPKEGNDMQRTKSKWYNYVNELEQLKYNKRQLKTNTSDVVMNIHNAATKYKLSKTKEGKMLKIYEAADKYITAKNKLLKRAKDQTVINSINEDINRKMQEAVADLDKISDD
jgi:predicted RNA methylase